MPPKRFRGWTLQSEDRNKAIRWKYACCSPWASRCSCFARRCSAPCGDESPSPEASEVPSKLLRGRSCFGTIGGGATACLPPPAAPPGGTTFSISAARSSTSPCCATPIRAGAARAPSGEFTNTEKGERYYSHATDSDAYIKAVEEERTRRVELQMDPKDVGHTCILLSRGPCIRSSSFKMRLPSPTVSHS